MASRSTEVEIFVALLELESAERAAYLEQACGADLDLRNRIDRYLHAHQIDDGPLDASPAELTDALASLVTDCRLGDTIGSYKLLEQIGIGGMGVVFMAEQRAPVRRTVALKIIKPGMDSKQVVARFEAERQALALMNHPNIAKVLDAGATDSGLPYFVMELVKGIPVNEYCDNHRLGIRERLELFIVICRAVQHAHQKGVIHRDLKPANVLVELHDIHPIPKVIDFGVAKATNQSLSERTLHTGFAQMIGTPMYMSPEQAQLSGLDVDTRSDVYSLGVMLYELISGQNPFDTQTLRLAGIDEVRRMIREVEPPRPSYRISTLASEDSSTVADRRRSDSRKLVNIVRCELDWIVMKSLEKDRTRRYESASAMASDVQRYLNGEAVKACPPSVGYQTMKYISKHRSMLAAASLIFLTAVVGTCVSGWYAYSASQRAVEATSAKSDAEREAERSGKLAIEAQEATALAEASASQAEMAQQREALHRVRAEKALYRADMRLAASQIDSGFHYDASQTLLDHVTWDDDGKSAAWEWLYLLGESTPSVRGWQASTDAVVDVDWIPDGTQIAAVSHDRTCRVFDASSGNPIQSWSLGYTIACCVRWSPDGRQLAWGSAAGEGLVRVWNSSNNEVTQFQPTTESVWSIDWNASGTEIITGSIQGERDPSRPDQPRTQNVQHHRFIDGEWKLADGGSTDRDITYIAWNYSQTLVAAVSWYGSLTILDPSTLKSLHKINDGAIMSGVWSPDSPQLVYARNTGEAVVFDTEKFKEVTRFPAHNGTFRGLDWSPNGKYLTTVGDDGEVKIWDTETWSLLRSFQGHEGIARRVSWRPDSQEIATVGDDGFVNIWSVSDHSNRYQWSHAHVQTSASFAWTNDDTIRIMGERKFIDVDPRTGQVVGTIDRLHKSNLRLLDANWGVNSGTSASQIFSTTDPQYVRHVPGIYQNAIAISPSGSQVVVVSKQNSIPVLCSADGSQQTLGDISPIIEVRQIQWSPTGKQLAIVGTGSESDDGNPRYGGWLHVFSLDDPTTYRRVQVGRDRVKASATTWSPDSLWIAAAAANGSCSLFDNLTLHALWTRKIHRSVVVSMDWHPDGSRVASAGEDLSVKIWDPAGGDVLLSLPVTKRIDRLQWSSDGTMLAAMDSDGTILVWDARHGQQVAESDQTLARQLANSSRKYSDALNQEDWGTASAILERVVTQPDMEATLSYYRLALLAAYVEDRESLTQNSERVLAKLPAQAPIQEQHFAVWACVLARGGLDDYAKAIAISQRVIEAEPDNQQYLIGHAALLFRVGKFDEAQKLLNASLAMESNAATPPVFAYFFLAMSEHELGKRDASLKQLDRANAAAQKQLADVPVWNRRLTIKLLQREANELIGANPSDN